jgi:LVIVD repeat-containing protein
MRRVFRFLLPFGLLAALVLPPTAAAVHNVDQHSLNMTKLFQSANQTGATNSDIAYWGDRAYVGNYSGVRIYDISNPASPQLLNDFRCNGPQNDPAVWGNLMFLAIDRTQMAPGQTPSREAASQCGSVNSVRPDGAAFHDDPNGWEGVRIFDVSNPAAVRQVGAIYTDCGAHTITLNPVSPSTVHLWVSSYPLNPGPTCGPTQGPAVGRHPHHGVIQIIEVPLANPAAAREIAEPQISYPGDPDNAFNPAEHDLPLLTMRACHDIQIHTKLRIAAAACAEQAQLWRIGPNGIPDTQNPIWVVDEVTDSDGPGGGDVQVDFWHSATFSWDGKVINFIDESFGSGCPTVTPVGLGTPTPSDSGWMFFYDARTGQKLSQMMMPRRTGDYCSAHLGNVAPVIGKYLLFNAWYTGGSNIVDFTNARSPSEAGYYYTERVPATGTPVTTPAADTWSHYWYENQRGDDNGAWSYGNDILGGFQVFRTSMRIVDVGLTRMNPQTQEDIFRCRINLAPRALHAGQARTLRATVRLRPGTAILPNQAVADVPVRFRGPGVSANLRANRSGIARLSVAPTRRGRITVSVRDVPNMRGCSARLRVAAAPRGGAAGGGIGLTGRRP